MLVSWKSPLTYWRNSQSLVNRAINGPGTSLKGSVVKLTIHFSANRTITNKAASFGPILFEKFVRVNIAMEGSKSCSFKEESNLWLGLQRRNIGILLFGQC